VEKQRREELTLPDVGKRTEQTTPEMGAARTRPWGRDVGLGEDTNELDLLQRRSNPVPAPKSSPRRTWGRDRSVSGRRQVRGTSAGLLLFRPPLPHTLIEFPRARLEVLQRAHPSPTLLSRARPFPRGASSLAR
jgi:hypothetical protein